MLLSFASLLIGMGVIVVGASWVWSAIKSMFSKKEES